MRHDKQTLRIGHDSDRLQQRIKIQKWFSRAHANEVGAAQRLFTNAIDIVEGNDYLFDNLSRS